jgi:acid phosphatase
MLHRSSTLALTLIGALLMGSLAACTTTRSATDQQGRSAQDSLRAVAQFSDPNLHSTLWTQTAVEYGAVARQAYALAEVMLERALQDSLWTASIEQAEMGSAAYRDLPPAVVLDVDETVLDNSAYQARLIRQNDTYSSDTWNDWVRERKATPVPGAVAFTRAAEQMGVEVIYLTNRDHVVEEATRDNLRRFDFPLNPSDDLLLTENERPEWDGSKTPRRQFLADQYRILLLIGDNFGDFAPGAERSVGERQRLSQTYQRYWGTRWIALPNAQYGSWEAALYEYNFGLPFLDKMERKYRHLDPAENPEDAP